MKNNKKRIRYFKRRYDIFISYRRDSGGHYAGRLYDRLKIKGYRVFKDIEDTRAGKYRESILARIDSAKDFLLILSPGALTFEKKDDLFLKEIERALETERHIIPIALKDFKWPEKMPGSIESIKNLKTFSGSSRLFDELFCELTKNHLISKRRRNFFRVLAVFGSVSMVLCGIMAAIYVNYRKLMPAFSLAVNPAQKIIDYLEDNDWTLDYTITNHGGQASSMVIKPEGALNFSVVLQENGMPSRVANCTLKFRNYFMDVYSCNDAKDRPVNIHESNAELAGRYLTAINDALREKDMYICEYTLKVYFNITYTDVLGIVHHDIFEPESNYNYIFNTQDSKSDENKDIFALYRYGLDTTLLKYKKPDTYHLFREASMQDMDEFSSDIKGIVNFIESNEGSFDVDCDYAKNNSTNDVPFIRSRLGYFGSINGFLNDNDGYGKGYHIKHKGCTMEEQGYVIDDGK